MEGKASRASALPTRGKHKAATSSSSSSSRPPSLRLARFGVFREPSASFESGTVAAAANAAAAASAAGSSAGASRNGAVVVGNNNNNAAGSSGTVAAGSLDGFESGWSETDSPRTSFSSFTSAATDVSAAAAAAAAAVVSVPSSSASSRSSSVARRPSLTASLPPSTKGAAVDSHISKIRRATLIIEQSKAAAAAEKVDKGNGQGNEKGPEEGGGGDGSGSREAKRGSVGGVNRRLFSEVLSATSSSAPAAFAGTDNAGTRRRREDARNRAEMEREQQQKEKQQQKPAESYAAVASSVAMAGAAAAAARAKARAKGHTQVLVLRRSSSGSRRSDGGESGRGGSGQVNAQQALTVRDVLADGKAPSNATDTPFGPPLAAALPKRAVAVPAATVSVVNVPLPVTGTFGGVSVSVPVATPLQIGSLQGDVLAQRRFGTSIADAILRKYEQAIEEARVAGVTLRGASSGSTRSSMLSSEGTRSGTGTGRSSSIASYDISPPPSPLPLEEGSSRNARVGSGGGDRGPDSCSDSDGRLGDLVMTCLHFLSSDVDFSTHGVSLVDGGRVFPRRKPEPEEGGAERLSSSSPSSSSSSSPFSSAAGASEVGPAATVPGPAQSKAPPPPSSFGVHEELERVAAATRADPVVILDPLDRSNNLGKGCYRARDVHKIFAAAELELAMLIVRPQERREDDKSGPVGSAIEGHEGRGFGDGKVGEKGNVAGNAASNGGRAGCDGDGDSDELVLRPERIRTDTLFQGLFILERLATAGTK